MQPTSEGVNSMMVCQPSVMMLVSPSQRDDASTISDPEILDLAAFLAHPG